MFKRIKNVDWWYFLKDNSNNNKTTKGLFSVHPRSTLQNKLLICWDFPEKNKTQKIYSLFNTYIDFVKYCLILPEHLRCFYELVIGEYPQKPHFDLDLNLKEYDLDSIKQKEILDNIITVIIETLDKKGVVLNLKKDICLYSSHGEHKISYHIIINNYFHVNNKEAKAFYYEVINQLPKEYWENKWIDPQVYSATQQFRCLGSQKYNTNRKKILVKKWRYINEEIIHESPEKGEDPDHNFLICFDEI